MSRSLTPALQLLRSKVLAEGKSEFSVFCGNRCVAVSLPSWEACDALARDLAAVNIGSEYRSEERRHLNGVVAVARCRRWLYVRPADWEV